MGKLSNDKADRVKIGLQLALNQERIAEDVGIAQSTVSAYHSALKAGEDFVPPEGYIRARERIKWMTEAGFDQGRAKELVQSIEDLQHVDVTPSKDSDNLSICEVASVLNVTHRLYDKKADKHEVAMQLSELAETHDAPSPGAQSVQKGEKSGFSPPRSMGEVAPKLDAQRGRTMSEAVRQMLG